MAIPVRPYLHTLLTGLAAGDSLGSTSEFRSPREMHKVIEKHRAMDWPFWQVGAGPFGWRPGQPTDDTDMAMGIVRAHLYQQRDHPDDPNPFNPVTVQEQFLGWMATAPADMGSTTRRSLSALGKGTPWSRGGKAVWESDRHAWANGSLMRNGVVAGMIDDIDQGFRASLRHGMMTHYAPLPQFCCAAQTYILWRILAWVGGDFDRPKLQFFKDWRQEFHDFFVSYANEETDPAVREWYATTYDDHAEAWDVFNDAKWGKDFDPWQYDGLMAKQGFCLLTLQIAVWALYHAATTQIETPGTAQYWNPELEEMGYPGRIFYRGGPWVLSWVAVIGGDTDTYGATAGPLVAGFHHGQMRGGLPTELRDGLEAVREYDELIKG